MIVLRCLVRFGMTTLVDVWMSFFTIRGVCLQHETRRNYYPRRAAGLDRRHTGFTISQTQISQLISLSQVKLLEPDLHLLRLTLTYIFSLLLT